jgi:hypothetical protein
MSPAQFIVPSGILAFASLLGAALTGLAIFKLNIAWVNMKWHIWLAGSALTFGVIHVALIKLFS